MTALPADQHTDIPWIISVDDHVVEPPHLWQERLPAKFRDRGPKVVRDSYQVEWINGNQTFALGGDGPKTDFWIYEDLVWCHQMLDPDERALAFTAQQIGAERVLWASDYPHPDAKIHGIVKELHEATESLPANDQALVAGGNAASFYNLPPLK